MKEDFQRLWEYWSPDWAGKFLDQWCTRAMRSKIDPMKKVARMLERQTRTDTQLVSCRREDLSRRRRGIQQQTETDHQKIVRLSDAEAL